MVISWASIIAIGAILILIFSEKLQEENDLPSTHQEANFDPPLELSKTHVTHHFKWSEFETQGITIPDKFKGNIYTLAVQLEKIRASIGKPIVITSGFCIRGHVKNSMHYVGKAADITVEGMTHEELWSHINNMMLSGAIIDGGLGRYDGKYHSTHYDIRSQHARWDWRKNK